MAKLKKAKQNEAPATPPKPDPIGDALVHHGLAPNTFLLDLNRALTVPRDMELPHPWSLPSRLFQFPIAITVQDKEGSRKLGLRHPLLADHPFVKRVESALHIELAPDPETTGYGTWWHSVDLVSAGKWRDLLQTTRFTTSHNIAGAVAFGLMYSPHEGKKRKGCISTKEAREIMATLDSPQPENHVHTIREQISSPSLVKSESGSERYPINQRPGDQFVGAWAFILGIEAGWFAYDRKGYLGWTESGRNSLDSSQDVTGFLADDLGPKPLSKPTQLSLF